MKRIPFREQHTYGYFTADRKYHNHKMATGQPTRVGWVEVSTEIRFHLVGKMYILQTNTPSRTSTHRSKAYFSQLANKMFIRGCQFSPPAKLVRPEGTRNVRSRNNEWPGGTFMMQIDWRKNEATYFSPNCSLNCTTGKVSRKDNEPRILQIPLHSLPRLPVYTLRDSYLESLDINLWSHLFRPDGLSLSGLYNAGAISRRQEVYIFSC